MKLHVPTGPLPILPPYFKPHDLRLADPEEEIDLGALFDRGESSDQAANSLPESVDEDFLDIDLADAFPQTPNPDAL
ncbi:MAG: hypothetical protein ABI672_14775 [Vicinamibacteria bacterium]